MPEEYPIEHHPLKPFLPDNSKILMLGSFPPAKKRWCMDFFYPNFINDMWRIFGIIFFDDKNHFIDIDEKRFNREKIISFLKEKGIALYDTACAIRRTKNTASDKDLEIIERTDLGILLGKIPKCCTIVTTGQKATDTITEYFQIKEPKIGGYSNFIFENRNMKLYRMPSSSRAYPMKAGQKAELYKTMFNSELSDNK